jgi:hypothetical protein
VIVGYDAFFSILQNRNVGWKSLNMCISTERLFDKRQFLKEALTE